MKIKIKRPEWLVKYLWKRWRKRFYKILARTSPNSAYDDKVISLEEIPPSLNSLYSPRAVYKPE